MFKTLFKSIGVMLCVFLTIGCTGIPNGMTPVDNFSIEKYQGKWYEIARLDHSFERGLEQISAEYSIKSNGDVNVVNQGYSTAKQQWKKATGTAKFVDKNDSGHLKVTFFGPFYGSYVIFYLDEEYQNAFVSGPDTSYLWFLSRNPKVSPELLNTFIEKASEHGFDTTKLIFVKHAKD